MVDLQRERSRAMLEASINVVPSCFKSLPRTSLHRVRGAPRGLDHPAALGLKDMFLAFKKNKIKYS